MEGESGAEARRDECEKGGDAKQAGGKGLGFWPVQMPIEPGYERADPFNRMADRPIELIGIAGESLDDDRERR